MIIAFTVIQFMPISFNIPFVGEFSVEESRWQILSVAMLGTIVIFFWIRRERASSDNAQTFGD